MSICYSRTGKNCSFYLRPKPGQKKPRCGSAKSDCCKTWGRIVRRIVTKKKLVTDKQLTGKLQNALRNGKKVIHEIEVEKIGIPPRRVIKTESYRII